MWVLEIVWYYLKLAMFLMSSLRFSPPCFGKWIIMILCHNSYIRLLVCNVQFHWTIMLQTHALILQLLEPIVEHLKKAVFWQALCLPYKSCLLLSCSFRVQSIYFFKNNKIKKNSVKRERHILWKSRWLDTIYIKNTKWK
jgi:hypothetical protein